MGFGNWKIGYRLAAGLGVAIIFMIGIAVVGIGNLGKLNNNTKDLATDKVPKVILAYETIGGLNDIARAMRNAMLSNEPAVVKAELERVGKRKVEINEKLDKLGVLIADDEDPQSKAKLQAVLDAREKYTVVQTAFVAMSGDDSKHDESVKYLLTTVRKEQTAYLNALGDLVKFQNAAVEDAASVAEQSYGSSRNMMILLTVLATALAAWVLYVITRSITQPLNRAVGMAQAVAGGDLTMRMECSTTDETGQLLRALIDMNDSLARTVGQVRSGTDTITNASNEIANGNLDLSSRTEQQASSLEETASSMEELTSTVSQNAANAREATKLVVAASDYATKGGRVVGEVVSTMGAIKESSSKIVDIISVIDGIAFQTNILALNAAVEAARAGEQGRGFAVVASEVRTLAQRSAAAAKEIKELIGRSVETVDAGASLVDQAGATMQNIVQSVQQVADIMQQISAASSEQSTGIEQVNQAIVSIDDVTQQNAALVEEAAAAAQSMRDQADLLQQAVSVFKLAGQPAAIAAPPRRMALTR
ncbi:methyl-accepting chemotaxis protein [Duganella sp. CF402]|uniref:methyl-accepting chemotaxis protein n=1 Tax=unclassified Duganella TaxID=2636909 RepID=UPI0008BA4BA1|nr:MULTISPECIES: methyl-accepting chemotaxis protein [unclassified Duganella]RZT08939.1 methyl-accepting chemotaxis protein [Duganella sp. BK701]SEL76240.1 methyl-accepting chemotaxis protein [Duganella sp. CF402]